jgi:hypothetical protein
MHYCLNFIIAFCLQYKTIKQPKLTIMKKIIALCLLCTGMLTQTFAQAPDAHKDDFVKLIQAAKTDFKEVMEEKIKKDGEYDVYNCSLVLGAANEGIIKKPNEAPTSYLAFFSTDKSNFSEYIKASQAMINVLILGGDKTANYKVAKSKDANGDAITVISNAEGYLVLKATNSDNEHFYSLIIFSASSKLKL